jgi:hypothetical protein
VTRQERSAVAAPATTARRPPSPAHPLLAPAPAAETPVGAAGPLWLLIVARGQDQLVVALRALFRNDGRIQVVEDRRDAPGLLPRVDSVGPGRLSATERLPERALAAAVSRRGGI